MKILKENAGVLTNFEVLNFLRSKGASKDPTRVLADVAPSEYKVYDYLVGTAACNQTRENVEEFFEKCKKYDLAKAEVLNVLHLRPTTLVEIDLIVEHCEMRLGDDFEELIEMVVEVLPAAPSKPENEEIMNEANEATENKRDTGEQMDVEQENTADG